MINIARTTENILGAVRDYLSKIFNGRTCIYSETIKISDTSTVKTLSLNSITDGKNVIIPTSAEITVEVGGTASTVTGAAVRYSISPTAPSGSTLADNIHGVPLGDFDTIEILGYNNLQAFKVIGVDTASSKYLKVQYFK